MFDTACYHCQGLFNNVEFELNFATARHSLTLLNLSYPQTDSLTLSKLPTDWYIRHCQTRWLNHTLKLLYSITAWCSLTLPNSSYHYPTHSMNYCLTQFNTAKLELTTFQHCLTPTSWYRVWHCQTHLDHCLTRSTLLNSSFPLLDTWLTTVWHSWCLM